MTDWTMEHSGPAAVLAVASGGVTGEARAVFTSKGHAYVTAGYGHGHPGELGYRDKHWTVALHVWASAGWGEDPAQPDAGGTVYDRASRDAPPTFRAAVVAAVTSAVAAFAAEHPGVPLRAEVHRLELEGERATDAMTKARVAYDATVVYRGEVLTLLAEARNHLTERAGVTP